MKKNSYSFNDLIICGNGELFGPGNAKLPLPPMLMFDRITEINDDNGTFNKGSLKARNSEDTLIAKGVTGSRQSVYLQPFDR